MALYSVMNVVSLRQVATTREKENGEWGKGEWGPTYKGQLGNNDGQDGQEINNKIC